MSPAAQHTDHGRCYAQQLSQPLSAIGDARRGVGNVARRTKPSALPLDLRECRYRSKLTAAPNLKPNASPLRVSRCSFDGFSDARGKLGGAGCRDSLLSEGKRDEKLILLRRNVENYPLLVTHAESPTSTRGRESPDFVHGTDSVSNQGEELGPWVISLAQNRS